MTVYLLLWILYCMTEGFDHAWYKAINHSRATLRRIALGALVVYGMCGAGAPFLLYINAALALAFIFTLVFDMTRNKASGEHLLYIGSTASLDKLMRKAPLIAWFLKLWAALVSVGLLYTEHDSYRIRITNLINQWLS